MATVREITHKIFWERAIAGEVFRQKVAHYFGLLKYDVVAEPLVLSPTFEERSRFKDRGDVQISGNGLIGTHYIEVKQLGCRFTSRKDWKFPYAIVCTRSSYDRLVKLGRKPFAYVEQSKSESHIIVMKTLHKPRWTVELIEDTYTGWTEPNYCANLDDAAFGWFNRLEELLFS